MLRFKVMG